MPAARFGLARLLLASLRHHRRAHLGAASGAAVAVAVLAGALLVGDSIRGSLRELKLERLGRVEWAVLKERPFGAALADRVGGSRELRARLGAPAAALLLRGSAAAERAEGEPPRVGGVSVLGIDARGLDALTPPGESPPPVPRGRKVLVNRRLAGDLGLKAGDPLLLFVESTSGTPRESLAGRRDDPARTLRLEVGEVIADSGAGVFSMASDQRSPRNVLLDREELTRMLGLAGRAGAVLYPLRVGSAGPGGPPERAALLDELRSALRAEDLGLRLRTVPGLGGRESLQVESEGFLLEPGLEEALREWAASRKARLSTVFTYLANTIALERPGAPRREIPYSTVTASDLAAVSEPASGPRPLHPGEIALGSWAAVDLGARVGDRVELEYYVVQAGGELETARASFRVAAVLPPGQLEDSSLTPEFPGVTTAAHLSDWDPPFPIDLKRIRPRDEEYWDARRATPKAFIALEEGRELWGSRFGRSTALRLDWPAARPGELERFRSALEGGLGESLDLARAGFNVRNLREEALSAAPATDFNALFLAFSAFLIAAAALLVGLLWAIGLDRRAREWGLLRAVGFSRKPVRRLALGEGLLVAGAGGLLGLAGAPLYALFLLWALSARWDPAVRPPRLDLHLEPSSLALGYLSALLVVAFSTWLAARRLARASPRELLSGGFGLGRRRALRRQGGRAARWAPGLVGGALLLLAAGLVSAGFWGRLPPRAAPLLFFGAGAALLGAGIAGFRALLAAPSRRGGPAGGPLARPGFKGRRALLWLGGLNAGRHPGRSTLTVALMACAAFVVVAAGAARHGGEEPEGRLSGTGGFALVATTEVPVFRRLDRPEGRAALGVPSAVSGAAVRWDEIEIFPLRLRSGDDASCLNLYRPREPRILGAPRELLERGGFLFRSSQADRRASAAASNPWLLLERLHPDGALPVIADEATATWVFHLGLGDRLELAGSGGAPTHLRLVAVLSGSILQGSLIVSERNLLALYPETPGYRFFLIGGPPGEVERARQALLSGLGPYGFDPVSASKLLREYQAVEEAYLETFGLLGGMGLLLGAAGLGAVLLRGAMERRGEMALLRALGFRRAALSTMVLAENALLVLAGLGTGAAAALVAAAPHLVGGGPPVAWGSLALTLLGAAAVGLAAGFLAVASVLRAPLLPALRAE